MPWVVSSLVHYQGIFMPKNNTLEADRLNKELCSLGLNDETLKEFKSLYEGLYLGRVVTEYKGIYKVATEKGTILSKVSGRIIYNAIDKSSYPAVGDWVAIDRVDAKEGDATIRGILSRKSSISRKVAGREINEQIIASNIDIIFICMSTNNDFNQRRLERYLSIAWDSGAIPVIVLTKVDLCEDIDKVVQEVEEVTIGITDILCVSSITEEGIQKVKGYLKFGKTVVFVGSSGVGKSTLINVLLGEEKQKVNDIRKDDDKGKHTTTYRELIVLPDGGIVIDTPGMREIQLLDEVDGIDDSFSDIKEISRQCKFSDCKHEKEPGCAVLEAIENGEISRERLNSYNKLKREAEYMKRKLRKKAGIKGKGSK